MATATNNPFDPSALADGTSSLTVRDSALGQSTDLVQAGVVFNDATRLLEGGLWNQPADSSNQQNYASMYQADITAVSDDISAILANPAATTIGGVAYTPSATDVATLTGIEGQLQTLLATAPNAAGNSASAVQAQQTLHALQTEIINEVANDPSLSAAVNQVQYATGTGANNVGFQALPSGADDPGTLSAATASGASLATIGQVFNAASDLAAGGLNSTNLTEFNNDMTAVAKGIGQIINNPTELAQIESGETAQQAALTTIHLDTVLNQVNLQINKFDPLYATDPNTAARSTNDNTLDIVDIVQNDANLNTAAGGTGNPSSTGGFAEFPAYLNGPDGANAHGGTILQFQDNQAQTNFWSAFVAEANTINNQLQTVAAGQQTPAQIQQLITDIQNYNNFGANFDAAQGGVFGARFDNELQSGTLLADTTNAVHGLTGIANGDTGAALAADQAQILAAGQGFVADANDVSGNNLPAGGGSYVGTATTVATATSPNGLAMGTIPVTANPDIADGIGSGGTATAATGGTGSAATGAGDGATGNSGGNGGQGTANAGSGGNGGQGTTNAGSGSATAGAPGAGDDGNRSGNGGQATASNGSGSATASTSGATDHGAGGDGQGHAGGLAALMQALHSGNVGAINAANGGLTAAGGDAPSGAASAAGGPSGGTLLSPLADGGSGDTTSPGDHHVFAHLWHA